MEHAFVTSHGSPHGHFSRAIAQRDVLAAEAAARGLGWVSLGDALSLLTLYAETEDPKFERAAVRWLDRLLEERLVALSEARRACEWLEQLAGPDANLAAGSLDGLVHGPGRSLSSPRGRTSSRADPVLGVRSPGRRADHDR